jgi:hypothetical protein
VSRFKICTRPPPGVAPRPAISKFESYQQSEHRRRPSERLLQLCGAGYLAPLAGRSAYDSLTVSTGYLVEILYPPQRVVPANAGIHSPCPLFLALGQKPCIRSDASGYGSQRFQPRANQARGSETLSVRRDDSWRDRFICDSPAACGERLSPPGGSLRATRCFGTETLSIRKGKQFALMP